MKIQAIRIQNLASLDGHTEIDFSVEPLSSAGIFAITGPTGAGKSTVLDALCLALYARTPRYRLAENGVDITDVLGSTIKQDDVRGILRDGTSNGYAEVDFVGIDGQYYRANWSVRRARNKADGNLQAYEMSLKNITTHLDIPGRKTELLAEIERLVGLNFEQFTRSVLLAQGDFTAFLKAGKDEKSSLLEKLTGTYIYSEISKKVFEHHREEQHQLRELNVKREGIAILTTAELSALQEREQVLNAAIIIADGQVTELNKELSWHRQWLIFQESVQSATEDYQQASNTKNEAKDREQQFEQIGRIQAARSIIDALQTTQELITTKSKLAEALSMRLISLEERKGIADATFEQAREIVNGRLKEEEQAQPLLNAAKALDVKLSEKAEQITQAKEDFALVCEKETRQKAQFSEVQTELEAAEKEIKELSDWKTINKLRQPIAEQESLILSKLNDAKGLLENLQSLTSRFHTVENTISTQKQQKKTLEDQRSTFETSLERKKAEWQSLNDALLVISIQEIENEKSALDTSIGDLIEASAHWKLLYQAKNEERALQQSLEKNSDGLKQSTSQLAEIEKLLTMAKSEKEASSKMLERAKLVAAESVEKLRNQLVPEEPCPVCGSTHHPYAAHHPALDLVLSQLQAEHEQIEDEYIQQQNSHSSLAQRCIELKRVISEGEEKSTITEKSLQELESAWSKFQVSEKCNERPFEERSDWLQQHLQQLKSRQQLLQGQIQSFREQKGLLDTLKAQLEELNKQFAEVDNQIKDAERLLKSLTEQQTKDTEEQLMARKKLDAVAQTVAIYFSNEEWFENWKTNPEGFETRIREFAQEWKTNVAQLEEHTRNQTTLTEKRKGLRELLKNTQEEVQIGEEKLANFQSQNEKLNDERMALFQGVAVARVEAKLKEAIELAKKTLEAQREIASEIHAEITRNQAQHEQFDVDINGLSSRELALNKQLKDWISKHNLQHQTELTEAKLVELLAYGQDWIESERTRLRAVDDVLMQAKSILEERDKALTTHAEQRLSARTLEELTILLSDAQELLKQHSQEASEIGFKVSNDKLNKQRIGTLLQAIEKQDALVENWAKLNEVIGSADGKKFRQIAQEYTLDALLSYANVHLEMLSKRYVLQRIPNSLGLQVIDQDMGDEVRTVYSLSGGESFLVSLALALGLASLSTSRMKVESLFIDEGFGSLDPTTLNMAMDALERLHNQGRKVGVISHVQEMTERIPVQIKVSKQHSGRSKVEVIGF